MRQPAGRDRPERPATASDAPWGPCAAYFANPRAAVLRAGQPICGIAIDAEEEFDWQSPVRGTGHSTASMRNIPQLQEILGAYGIVPAYLLTYPVLEDAEVVRILRKQMDRGECIAGVQLHPWVNPPFEDDIGHGASFSGNLRPDLEERKILALRRRFIACFGQEPRIYRAGRYGLGRRTADTLEKLGFSIDTSLAPRTDFGAEGGPDYKDSDYRPFWFGKAQDLLELPLCRSIIGWSGKLASCLYHAASGPLAKRWHLHALLARARCAERITLSPEGNDTAAMARLLRGLLHRGERIFVLSFHSSSLAPGRNPYVQTRADLHAFYDRLSGILDRMRTRYDIRFASLSEIPSYLEAPPR